MSRVKVELFGRAADVLGQACLEMEADTAFEVRQKLFGNICADQGVPLESFWMSCNHERLLADRIVSEGDEIGLFSPFSGG